MLFQVLDLRGLPVDAEIKLSPDKAIVTLPGQEPMIYGAGPNYLLDADLPKIEVASDDMAHLRVQVG